MRLTTNSSLKPKLRITSNLSDLFLEAQPQVIAKKALQLKLKKDDLVPLGYIQEGRCPRPSIKKLVSTPCKTRHNSAVRGQTGYDTTDKKGLQYGKCKKDCPED